MIKRIDILIKEPIKIIDINKSLWWSKDKLQFFFSPPKVLDKEETCKSLHKQE